ncbi:MAG: ribonuclease P protein component [Candidatus Latescibacteria bacterium]|nr:ribonuclease P protein component [Candidatus Latescibacterota bacterium]
MPRPGSRLRSEVQHLRRTGSVFRGRWLHVRACRSTEDRIFISVRKRFGKAVARNRARRRIRAVCREMAPHRSTGHLVIISVGDGSAAAGFRDLRSEIFAAFGKLGLLHGSAIPPLGLLPR